MSSVLGVHHPVFSYLNSGWKIIGSDLQLFFHYHTEPSLDFFPTITIKNIGIKQLSRIPPGEMSKYVFHIGLAEMYSYWKATASPTIQIAAGHLKPKQVEFWQKLLLQGMGEYFYVNQLDFTEPDFIKFEVPSAADDEKTSNIQANPSYLDTTDQTSAVNLTKKIDSILIPMGGGKDSLVTYEILKESSFPLTISSVNPTQATQKIFEYLSPQLENQPLIIERQLDPLLLEMNQQGYLNGHVPISAVFTFIYLLIGRLLNISHIALSNERSSNEGNLTYLGKEVNHQYSKSYEFENNLQVYANRYLPPTTPFYFSLMRPLYELQITKRFSKMTKYHSLFRSCNQGQQKNIWCGQCPKCLFGFISLLPFLGIKDTSDIFGQNILENENLWPIAQELIGQTIKKPFECVGTHEESIVAFHLCHKEYQKVKQSIPSLLEKVIESALQFELDLDNRSHRLLESWNDEHSLNPELIELIKEEKTK